jgi:putative phosphoesterase
MRLAVISDIHGNHYALEVALNDIQNQRVDQIVCLGDAIQGGSQPKQTVDALRALNCPIVMGNADAWLLTGIETADEGIPPERKQKMEMIRQWSLSQLTDADRAFISKFQLTVTLTLEDIKLLCFHGSPTSFDDVILPDSPKEVFDKYLGAYTGHILTGGHTHAQQVRPVGDLFFFNPGSVGLAFAQFQPDGQFHMDAWAEYAILAVEDGQTSLEFRRLPFDTNKLIEIHRAGGRPFAQDAIAQYQR